MFQPSIEVTKPHFKPVVNKAATVIEASDEDSIMPLEYFTTYELELHETIQQLNSELAGDSEESDCEEDCVFMNGSLHNDKPSDSESASSEDLEPPKECHEIQINTNTNEFGDCELSLHHAVLELTNLSDTLVRILRVKRRCIG